MPGDVVLGTRSGVIFIPPHLAEEVVIGAEKSHVKDMFGFKRLGEKKYTTAQIDSRWTVEMFEDFLAWFKSDSEAQRYSYLDWNAEFENLKKWYDEHPEAKANDASVTL